MERKAAGTVFEGKNEISEEKVTQPPFSPFRMATFHSKTVVAVVGLLHSFVCKM